MAGAIDLDKPFTEDAILEIAKGNVPGSSIVQLTGRNPHVSTTYEDISDIGSVYTLAYDAQVGNFTVGDTVTGAGGATGVIIMDIDNGATGTLYIRNLLIANFADNERIVDTGTGDATVNEPVTGQQNKIRARVNPTSGGRFEAICENVNDQIAGTGARTILVEFLEEATGLYTTELIDLNGHTAVLFTSTDAFRFRRMAVVDWGAQTPHPVVGKTNLGSIIVRDSVTKDIQGVISMDDADANDTFGLNNTIGIYYTVPKGHTAYPTFVTINTVKGNDILARAIAVGNGVEGASTVGEIGVYQNSFIEALTVGEQGIPALTDFKIIAKSSNTDTLVNVQAIIVLVKD